MTPTPLPPPVGSGEGAVKRKAASEEAAGRPAAKKACVDEDNRPDKIVTVLVIFWREVGPLPTRSR